MSIQQLHGNVIIYLNLCLKPADECKSNIHSLLALFLVSTNSWGKYLAL